MKPNFTPQDVKIIAKQTVFKGFFQMVKYTFQHKLFNGNWSQPIERELFERSHAAALLPYDPIRDEVVLIEQVRVGALEHDNPWQLEIVAGIMEEGENPEALCRREAREEAGLEINNIVLVASFYPSAGGCSEKLDVFVGETNTLDAGGVYGLEYENEDIYAQVFSREEAYELVNNGKIENGASIIALQWLEINHKKLRLQWQK